MGDFFFGALFGAIIIFPVGVDYGQREARTAVETCEKELPRNQHCVIIAVPEQDKAYD